MSEVHGSPRRPEEVQAQAPTTASAQFLPLEGIARLQEPTLTAAQKVDKEIVRVLGRLAGQSTQKESAKDREFNELVEVIKKFRDPADWDDDQLQSEVLLVDGFAAELISLGAILANIIVIAAETDFQEIPSPSTPLLNPDTARNPLWLVFEGFFFVLFSVELAAKLFFHRLQWFRCGDRCHHIEWMNVVAALTVVVLMADFALDLVELITRTTIQENGKLRLISLLRMFELARLKDRVKDATIVRELRMVIRGLGACYRVITWTVLLVLFIVYILAVVATTQIGYRSDMYDDYRKLSGGWDVNEYFGSVFTSMTTFLRMLTLDGWSSEVGRHVATQQPAMSLLFVAFILVVTFGLLSFVLSLIVHQTLEFEKGNQAKLQARQERARRNELEQIKDIFEMADKDGSKELDAIEFLEACKSAYVRDIMYQLQLPIDDAAKLFEVVDGEEGHRTLHQDEFIEGCMQLKGAAMSKDMLRLLSQADMLAKRMDILHDALTKTEDDMALLDEISWRIFHRFEPTVLASRSKIARDVAGSQPMVPVPRNKPGEDCSAPLAIGNRPVLPKLPDLLK